MLKILTVAGLTALLTTAALAQTQPQAKTRPAPHPQAAVTAPIEPQEDDGYGAYAGPSPYDVIESGQLLGRDPDPNVRLQLKRGYGSENY